MMFMQELARLAAAARGQTFDESIGDEAVRGLVDWLACCLAGPPEIFTARASSSWEPSGSPSNAQGLLQAAARWTGRAAASRYCALHTPAGMALAAPVFGALMPLAESRASPGSEALHAYLVGIEAACRAACAAAGRNDDDPDAGVVTLCGAVGAATACSVLLALDATRTEAALAAAARGCGEAEDAAHAASVGLGAALGAQAGAAHPDWHLRDAAETRQAADPLLRATSLHALDGWGSEWHCRYVTYRIYPCDRALHAAVEACHALRAKHRVHARQIGAIEIRLHPRSLQQGGAPSQQEAPQSSGELSRLAAAAFVDADLGAEGYARDRLRGKRTEALRSLVTTLADSALGADAAHVRVRLRDGPEFEHQLNHALGSPARPLGDAELSAKFRRLAADPLATDQAERLLGLAWNARALADVGTLLRATVPEEVLEAAELPGSPLIPR